MKPKTISRGLLWSLAFLISNCAVAQASSSSDAIQKKVAPAVAQVIALDAHGKILTSTTGFFVSENGDIITFHRPLLRASRIEIKRADGKTGSVVGVVSENSEADLVRLSTTLTNSPVVLSNMAKSLPRENEKVIVLGPKRAVEVRALDVAEMPLFGNVFTARLSPSAEFVGAPIVNVNGELVGLITSIQRKSRAIALANDFLRRLPSASPKPFAQWKMELKPNWAHTEEGFYATGIQHTLAGDHEKALPWFKKSFETNPTNHTAAFRMARAERGLNRYKDAIDHYQLALKLKPNFSEAYGGLGLSYEGLRQNDKAIDAFKKAIELDPRYETPYLRLANLYADKGKEKEAIAIILSLTRIKPDSFEGHGWLGWLYAKSNESELSKKSYLKAVEINPRFRESLPWSWKLLSGSHGSQDRVGTFQKGF